MPKHALPAPQDRWIRDEFAGLNVDVRIVGEQVDVLAEGKVIATHQRSPRKNVYVTESEHAPAFLEETTGLWTRAYFLRQAAKVGPGTVAALTRLLDGKKIEAQGFRSCMNILDLGKRGSRLQLEQACKQLTENDAHRQISYTAVKHALAVVRAAHDQRPQVAEATESPVGVASRQYGRPEGRDTSGAHLAGPAAFTLEALTGTHSGTEDTNV